MNFEFFAFLVFMSFVSFATAFLAYGMVVRFMGKEGTFARMGQVILVPACVIFYDFICMAAPEGYRYLLGGLPLLAVAGLALYYRFVKGEDFANPEKTPTELAQANNEPKKFSKKSARIHAARKKRGRE
ncbi:hypothetical protein [uncultured Phascolarctobacterium sp.]|uniref:hypothetical protein n=1 Tax=uncultured Phascolarctobacterium sp. TaxID=512296 RepID=UPI00262C9469|nr:hypothetical protein [uncultured Phascolarctobacterium sp.]